MGIVQRLRQFIEIKGISKYKFYQSTKLSNGSLDKGDNLGSDKCEKILYAFPELNPDWLLTGRGSMLKSESTSPTGEYVSDSLPQPMEESLLYTMYKEEKAENKELIEQIGALKQQIKTLEEKIAELQLSPLPNVASVGSTQIRKSDAVDLGDVQFVGQ